MSDPLNADDTPAPWRRWASTLYTSGSLVLSHVLAILVAFTCLLTLPLALFTLLFITGVLLAIVTNGDLGGPLFLPFGVIAIFVVGVSCSIVVCAAGLTTDLLRRALRWPIWVSPLAVSVMGFFVPLCFRLVSRVAPPEALTDAALIGALIITAFSTYWIPLALSDKFLRLMRRVVGSLHERYRRSRNRKHGVS